MSFADSVARFADKAKGNADEVVRQVTMTIADRLVDKSPVGNPDVWLSLNPYVSLDTNKLERKKAPAGYVGGRFRANWQIGAGSPDTTATNEVDPGGSNTKTRLSAAIDNTGAGGITYVTNSLPYGPKLEYEGHSSQAPSGFVRTTAAEFRQYVSQALEQIR